MLQHLAIYYDSKGILPTNFCCPHATECSAGAPRFVGAKASSVGTEYENGNGPRLLFLSLDPGSGDADPQKRTLEVMQAQERWQDVNRLPKNKHWYLTHLMTWELLRHFHRHLTIERTRRYFAHVNSAKCSQNNPRHRKAGALVFENCRKFIPDELRILAPDILVTQGGEARTVVVKELRLLKHDQRDVEGARYETGIIQLTPSKQALWLQTYHPNNYGRFHPQRKKCWPLYVEAVKAFMSTAAARAAS